MGIRRAFLVLFFAVLVGRVPHLAAHPKPGPSVALTNAIATLSQEALIEEDTSALLAELIQKEYGTHESELLWATKHSLGWGEITTLAYIQATTGKTFAQMITENARQDFWSYADNAGMNCEKMARSLESFLKRAERERNSRIFDRLRAGRKVHPLPDLGSGFGLFQEALDFRRIEDSPRLTKIHEVPGVLAKGEK